MSSNGAGDWSVAGYDKLQEFGFSTFGEDASGELYVANHATGALYQVGVQ